MKVLKRTPALLDCEAQAQEDISVGGQEKTWSKTSWVVRQAPRGRDMMTDTGGTR